MQPALMAGFFLPGHPAKLHETDTITWFAVCIQSGQQLENKNST